MKYTLEPLSILDNEKLRKRVRGGYLFAALAVVMLILLAVLMLTSRKYSREPGMVWLLVGILGVIMAIFSVPAYFRLTADERSQMKYCGEFPAEKVIDSGKYNTHFFLKVVIDGISHKLKVSKEVYDAILPGESVYAEFTPSSNTLLKLICDGKEKSV